MSAAAFPGLGGDVPAEMIREFLDIYEQKLGQHAQLFAGVAGILDAIEAVGSRWGIVTQQARVSGQENPAGLGLGVTQCRF